VVAHIDGFDPVALLHWLGWSAPEAVRQSAGRLLLRAKSIDPMGNWHKVVRLGRSGMWQKLRGEALVAMDRRIAAEMLLQLYEDLVSCGVARAGTGVRTCRSCRTHQT
jgi:hypothetical protein